jgi:hypothetical protein
MKKHMTITMIKNNKPKFKIIFIKRFMTEMIKYQAIGSMAYLMDKLKYNIKMEIILSNFEFILEENFRKDIKLMVLWYLKIKDHIKELFIMSSFMEKEFYD